MTTLSTMTTDTVSNTQDVIDSRDIIARINELEPRTLCDNCGEPAKVDDNGAGGTVVVHEYGSTVCYDDPPGSVEDGDTTTYAELSDPLDEDERTELASLQAVQEQANWGDWQYGTTLVHEDYFEDYAREMAEEIGAIPADNKWPTYCIDWEWAARELRMDYISVDFDGATYWVRG